MHIEAQEIEVSVQYLDIMMWLIAFVYIFLLFLSV